MADIVTGPQILQQNDNRVTVKLVIQSDGTGNPSTPIVMGDVSALDANTLGQAVARISIQQLWFSCSEGDGGDAFARLEYEDDDGDIPIITLVSSGNFDFREFGGLPANTSSNTNQNDIQVVIPSTVDSGNTFSIIAEFQKIY